jgi:7-cyano-7-deazaguanine synthase
MKKGLVVFSGGMDSTVLLYMMHRQFHDVEAITFNYGQRHHKEIECAAAITKTLGVKHKIVDLSVLQNLLGGSALTASDIKVPDGHYTDESMKVTVVPNRNMIMLSIACGYAISQNIGTVGMAVHAGDHTIYPDCRPDFIARVSQAVVEGNDIAPFIFTPFINRTKTDIAKIGRTLDVPFEKTWSCYKGGDTQCGVCGTCVERLEALRDS